MERAGTPSEPAAPGEERLAPVAVAAHPAAARSAGAVPAAAHEPPVSEVESGPPAHAVESRGITTEAGVPSTRPLLRGVRRALGRQPAARRESQPTRPSAPSPAVGTPATAPQRPAGTVVRTPSRPQLRVARRPGPPPTIARKPRLPSGSSAASLAAATGAPISHEPDGTAAITFHEEAAPPPRPAPVAGPGPTIARATGPGGPTLARAATPASGTGGGDAYEDFVDRLRRDLLREREQVGDLLGDKW